MPNCNASSKVNTQTIRGLKGRRPITALTAYDYIMARLAGEAGVDLLLVGDSVGTTILGLPTTVQVSLEMMVHHTAAVARARPAALIITDIPFPEAHRSQDSLLDASARCIREGGAEGVKIEGGAAMAGKIAGLVEAGIPVLGHIGLLPQQVYRLGGYRKFGKTPAEREALIADALAVEAAGAFAVVMEMVEPELAREITARLKIPTLGIGAGPHCDGQILVSHDILGLTQGNIPSFAKPYASLGDTMREAFLQYVDDVQNRRHPS
jgi:3-methyl-2-oxobutanoate hydroxymethyltransferase